MTFVIQEKKCSRCSMVKGVAAFSKNYKGIDGRKGICKICDSKQRKKTFGASFEDMKSRAPVLTNWPDTHAAGLAWHIARERQQDLMHRSVPYYPTNEDSFKN